MDTFDVLSCGQLGLRVRKGIAVIIKTKGAEVFLLDNGSNVGLGIKQIYNRLLEAVAAFLTNHAGILAGFAVVFGIEFVDKTLKIDDPVGAVGVHCLNGALGTICVGLFSDGAGTDGKLGLFTGGGVELLGTQCIG